MEDLARLYVEKHRQDVRIDLGAYPEEVLASAAVGIVDMPEAADFLRELLGLGTNGGYAAAARLVSATADPGVMAETVRLLAGSPVEEPGARALHLAFLRQSAARDRYHATRSHALLGAVYVSQGRPSLLRKLQAHLLDIDLADDGEYLRHAARIHGLVLAHVNDDDLKCRLELLLDNVQAEDEAAFALGLLDIAAALEDVTRATALAKFSRARDLMARAIGAAEARYDAELYAACLDMLLDFQDGVRSEAIQLRVEAIRKAAFSYSAHLIPSDRSMDQRGWLGASLLEGMLWAELGHRLGCLDLSLLKKAWLDAARIIEEELVRIFDASRSVLKRSSDGGIEAIVRPRISVAIQKERYRLDLLDQWLAANSEGQPASAVAAMRADVSGAMEASLSRNPTEAAAADTAAAEPIRQSLARGEQSVPAMLALMAEEYFDLGDAVFQEVLEKLNRKLVANPDYKGAAQFLFLRVVYYTLMFLRSRENVNRTSVAGVEYLFNLSTTKPPVEADLHRDYLGFLQSTPLQAHAKSESRGRAHGRSDVDFALAGNETVAELKKTDRDLSLGQLVHLFGNQASAYQRTSMTTCALLVLDLFDRNGGSDNIRALADVIPHRPPSGTTEYSVAVFRIQGRKRPPSHL